MSQLHWQPITLIAVVILVGVSAFASSSETAFFSLNRFQLRRIKDRYRSAYARIRTLLGHPSRLLVMILLINEIVNLTISSLIAEFIQTNKQVLFGSVDEHKEWLLTTLISLAISLPTLLLMGEITPKVIAAKMNRLVAMANSRVLIVLYKLLYPILYVVDAAIGYILRKFKAEGRDHLSKTMSVLSEEDFMLLMEEGHREGTVDPSERKLIKNVFEFDDSTVSEVMTPIAQSFTISMNSKIPEVLPEIRMQKYSRVPVFQKSKKNIVGMLYVKDLLTLRTHPDLKDLEVRSVVTRPMFVNPTTRLSNLFRRFKETKTHIAVVGAENGEALGIVTMEDVLESIFGEIADERDVK